MLGKLKKPHKFLYSIGAMLCAAIIIFSYNEAQAVAPFTCTDAPTMQTAMQCCKALPGLFFRLDDCTRSLLKVTTNTFIINMVGQIRFMVTMTLVLAMVIFGFRVATGALGNRTKGQAFILVIKMALIIWLINNLGIIQFTNFITSAGQDIASVVIGAPVFKEVDRVFFAFFGVIGTNMTIGAGLALAGVLTALLFIGPLGIMVVTYTVIAIFFVAMAFTTVVYTVFLATVAMIFFVMIAPITVPFFVFNPNTIPRKIFDGWVKQTLSYTLQVPIMYACVAIMVLVFQAITGAGMAAPPPNTILGMILSAPITFKPLIDFVIFKINFPFIGWDMDTIAKFGGLIFVAFIMSIAMIAFFKGLPGLMLRLVGNIGDTPLMGQAIGDAESLGGAAFTGMVGGKDRYGRPVTGLITYASRGTQSLVKGTVNRGFKMVGIDLKNLMK